MFPFCDQQEILRRWALTGMVGGEFIPHILFFFTRRGNHEQSPDAIRLLLIDTEVRGDAIYPSGEFSGGFIGGSRLPGPQEYLLSQIFGLDPVSYKTIDKIEN